MSIQRNICLIIISLALFACVSSTSFRIPNIPFHRQITRWSCGDASFEMVYHHFRKDIDQRAIINVARTSQHNGTTVWDLVRAAHFSKLSATPSDRYYPQQAPQNGWDPEIPYGMAAFGYRGDSCWIEGLKEVIGQGYPIIVLNHFSEASPGGHFRVAVGFDNDTITLLDPWDRRWERIVTYTNEEFCTQIWDYPKWWDTYTSPPFWAGIFTPWKVDVSFEASATKSKSDEYLNYITVHATVTYPCPAPFCTEGKPSLQETEFVARNTNVTISFPSNMALAGSKEQQLSFKLGDFIPGTSHSVEWDLEIDDSLDVKFGSQPVGTTIRVEAVGLITAAVPKAFCCYNLQGGEYYPPYTYTDLIGAHGEAHY